MANRLPKRSERLRGTIREMVKQGHKSLKAASLELGMSYRQAKRVYRRYRGGGDEALIHGNTGKPSSRRTDPELVCQALSLYAEKYDDFGPALACEKLAERDGVEIGVSVLRRALIAAGLWKPEQNGREYRSRRVAREHGGELVPFDGSRRTKVRHDWFEGRRGRCCRITLTDDATKTRLSPFFEEETLCGAMTVLKRWIEPYGIPESLYCDR